MQDLESFFRDGWGLLQPYPPVQAGLIVLVFLLLAKIVDWICSGMIRRIVARTRTNLDDQLVDLLHRPVFASVALTGLIFAAYRLDLGEDFERPVVDIIQTVLVVIWLFFGLGFARLFINYLGGEKSKSRIVQPATRPLVNNAVAVVLVLGAVYAILVTWEINVTGLVASAGIVGLALSFAAQDTLANLFAGIAILADRPYQLDDYIIIDSGERGRVTNIGLRSTRLLTRDDVEVTIPNSVMGGAKIVNEAGGPRDRYRLRVPVGVAYGSDIDKVMAVLLDVSNAHEKVSATPEARVRFRQFGESSLDFELLCWIRDPALRGLVLHELNCNIYKAFASEDIEIPFPQRDLYVKSMPGAWLADA
jgi:small-conductance mechanosensitive channel